MTHAFNWWVGNITNSTHAFVLILILLLSFPLGRGLELLDRLQGIRQKTWTGKKKQRNDKKIYCPNCC